MTAGIVIIGGGIASLECARHLRRNGYAGRITILSAEAVLPYERPVLSKAALGNGKTQIPLLTSEDELHAADIRFCLQQRAEQIVRPEHYVLTADGRRHYYNQLVIATGAQPKRLVTAGSDLAGVFYLREWSDAVALRDALIEAASVVVIGGGLIGLEVASAMLEHGKQVTVVEGTAFIMSRSLPSALSLFALNRLSTDGVDFALGRTVCGISGEGRVRGVVLDNGTELLTDAVVCGIGAVPNDSLAFSAGLKTSDGVHTDRHGRTSDANIFAIGDAAHWGALDSPAGKRYETYNDAIFQAHVVAASICDQVSDGSMLSTFWSDQHGLQIQGAGDAEGDTTVIRHAGNAQTISALVLKSGQAIGAFAINAPADFSALKRFVGRRIQPATAALIADPGIQLRLLLCELERVAA